MEKIKNNYYKFKEFHMGEKKYSIDFLHYENGNIETEIHCINDELYKKIYYREDGKTEYKLYFQNRKYHKENGPAVIEYDKDGNIEKEEYYLNGKQITDIFQISIMKGLK